MQRDFLQSGIKKIIVLSEPSCAVCRVVCKEKNGMQMDCKDFIFVYSMFVRWKD